jgi:hypothetical protein
VLPADALIDAMISAGRIDEQAALDRAEVERVAAQVLAEWIARWRH